MYVRAVSHIRIFGLYLNENMLRMNNLMQRKYSSIAWDKAINFNDLKQRFPKYRYYTLAGCI